MPNVDITIRTINESEAGNKRAIGSLTELKSGIDLVSKGLQIAKQVYMQTIDVTLKYADSVRDLALASGTGAEESSRLLQVLDDYQITAQEVTAATRFMTKAGLTPTIETLAKLSDQYNAINDPMQKNEFILKNLGRGGLQWVNVLKQGGDALREQSQAVNENLILTDEQIKQTERYRLKIDQVKDTIEGYKIAATMAFFDAADAQEKLTETARAYGHAAIDNTGIIMIGKERQEELTDEIARATQYGKAWAAVLGEEVTPAVEEDTQALKEMAEANQDLINLVGRLSDDQRSYAEQQKEISEDLSLSDDERAAKLEELAQKQEDASHRMILSMLEQQLAMGGLTTAETTYLLDLGLKWGVYTQTAVDQARAALEEVNALTEAFNALPTEKTMTITVIGGEQAFTTSGPKGGGNQRVTKRASGGPVKAGELYQVNESGVELFRPSSDGNIIPHNQSGNAGNNIIVNINFSGDVADPESTAQRLAPAIKRVLRQERVIGG